MVQGWMTTMSKLGDIIKGWRNDYKYNRGNIPQPIRDLFDERVAICRTNECGRLVGFVCSACGCPIKKKSKVISQTCPENMWKPKIYSDESGDVFILFDDVTESLRPLLRAYLCNFTEPQWCEYYINEFNRFGSTFGLAVFIDNWEGFLKYLEEMV